MHSNRLILNLQHVLRNFWKILIFAYFFEILAENCAFWGQNETRELENCRKSMKMIENHLESCKNQKKRKKLPSQVMQKSGVRWSALAARLLGKTCLARGNWPIWEFKRGIDKRNEIISVSLGTENDKSIDWAKLKGKNIDSSGGSCVCFAFEEKERITRIMNTFRWHGL